jgi:hypothetical protein
VGQSRECCAEKGYTSLGGTGVWGMRDCRLVAVVGTLD